MEAMTPAERAALRELLANKPDCHGNPCIFGNTGGQRTQGGCHCIPRGGMKPGVSSFIQRATEALPALLDAADERDRLWEALHEAREALVKDWDRPVAIAKVIKRIDAVLYGPTADGRRDS